MERSRFFPVCHGVLGPAGTVAMLGHTALPWSGHSLLEGRGGLVRPSTQFPFAYLLSQFPILEMVSVLPPHSAGLSGRVPVPPAWRPAPCGRPSVLWRQASCSSPGCPCPLQAPTVVNGKGSRCLGLAQQEAETRGGTSARSTPTSRSPRFDVLIVMEY